MKLILKTFAKAVWSCFVAGKLENAGKLEFAIRQKVAYLICYLDYRFKLNVWPD